MCVIEKVSLVEYEVSISHGSKVMANVKVFCHSDRQTDGWTDRQTGQKLDAPNLSFQGHKKYGCL